jgi:hypothetical protein
VRASSYPLTILHAQERDRNNKITPGDFTTVRGVLYLVPKSLKDADARVEPTNRPVSYLYLVRI